MKKISIFWLFLLSMFCSASAQTTIITHGFGAGTSDPVNGWMLDMANAIRNRLGDAVVRVYNGQTGNFDYSIGSGTQTVLIFDWLQACNNFQSGFSEDAGAALFAALIQGQQQGDFSFNTLHFIGHSRGTAVNSEVAERLLVAGFPVAQLTAIDAHDWGGTGFFDDYDCNPSSWNSGVEGWQGLTWADSYWQESLFTLNGRAVDGTYSEFMGNIGHGGIRDWYQETISDTTIHDGYYYSINGPGYNSRPARTGTQRVPAFNFYNDGILNGDFERGALLTQSFAGWVYHGGGGNATIDNNYLALKSSSAENKIHNRFYIPANALKIQFDYKIDSEDNDNPSPNVDKLLILINGNPACSPMLMDSVMNNWATTSFFITNYRNTVKTLEFKLVDENGGDNNINSEVWIDNIKMTLDQTVAVNESVEKRIESMVAPNPFADNTTIFYALKSSDYVTIKVFNIMGGEVATLAENQFTTNGNHKMVFDASGLNAGMYFVKIQIGKSTQTYKIVIAR